MRVLVACLRGDAGPRDRFGHCMGPACLEARADYRRRSAGPKREYVRAWVARNPDKVREYARKWVAANTEQRRAIERDWRQRNPDAVKAMNARGGRKWASQNKGKRNASVKARQMAKRQAMPAWVDKQALAAFYVEAERRTRETGIPHEVDHIAPLQAELACGLHVPANLQVLPRFANRSKRNRMEGLTWPAC